VVQERQSAATGVRADEIRAAIGLSTIFLRPAIAPFYALGQCRLLPKLLGRA
jgi:hypothetical protein